MSCLPPKIRGERGTIFTCIFRFCVYEHIYVHVCVCIHVCDYINIRVSSFSVWSQIQGTWGALRRGK